MNIITFDSETFLSRKDKMNPSVLGRSGGAEHHQEILEAQTGKFSPGKTVLLRTYAENLKEQGYNTKEKIE